MQIRTRQWNTPVWDGIIVQVRVDFSVAFQRKKPAAIGVKAPFPRIYRTGFGFLG
jgi:hypothetical protein